MIYEKDDGLKFNEVMEFNCQLIAFQFSMILILII